MNLRNFFPLNYKVQSQNAASLWPVIILYLLLSGAAGAVVWLTGWIPLFGWLIRCVCSLIGFYALAGIFLALWDYFH